MGVSMHEGKEVPFTDFTQSFIMNRPNEAFTSSALTSVPSKARSPGESALTAL